mgnify:CR=1 FL=1
MDNMEWNQAHNGPVVSRCKLPAPQPFGLPSPSSRPYGAGLTGHPVLGGLKCESRTFLPYRLSGFGAVLNVANTGKPPSCSEEVSYDCS